MFKDDVSQISFHIYTTLNYVSNPFWAHTDLFNGISKQHTPLKQRTLNDEHVPFIHSELRKQIHTKICLK